MYDIFWGYPPPTNSEIIICSFLWRAPYKPSLSTVSGLGIPPRYIILHFFNHTIIPNQLKVGKYTIVPWIRLDTLPETNSKRPWKLAISKGNEKVFQPCIFRGKLAVRFREGYIFRCLFFGRREKLPAIKTLLGLRRDWQGSLWLGLSCGTLAESACGGHQDSWDQEHRT